MVAGGIVADHQTGGQIDDRPRRETVRVARSCIRLLLHLSVGLIDPLMLTVTFAGRKAEASGRALRHGR